MPFRLFDLPEREASSFISFSGNRLNRLSEKRSDDAVEKALVDPATRLMFFADGRLFLKLVDGTFDPHFSVADLEAFSGDRANAVLLGLDEQGPLLAVPSLADLEKLPENVKAIDYGSINMQGLIASELLGAMAQGAALLAWNATHKFCGRCGHETRMAAAGMKRVCSNCGAQHFPRTDPVAIMLAVRGDRCLLGRGVNFRPDMYSALAGFIEPGETIEDAVRRETFEEAGIRLGRVAYYANQPWPFPHTLMIGCFGEALNEDIRIDQSELADCRWFARDEVRLAMEGRHAEGIIVPPKSAIAHHLVKAWAEAE